MPGMIGLIIFLQMRNSPPISSVRALTSPMEPPMYPRNISMFVRKLSAALMQVLPSGVGPVRSHLAHSVEGTGHVVISVAKAMNSTILAVIAGFTRFLPMPP